MRSLVLRHQHKRLVRITAVFQPGKREVAYDVGGVTDMFHPLRISITVLILQHGWIIVWSLANQNLRVIVPLRRHMLSQMPFANHGPSGNRLSEAVWGMSAEFRQIDFHSAKSHSYANTSQSEWLHAGVHKWNWST